MNKIVKRVNHKICTYVLSKSYRKVLDEHPVEFPEDGKPIKLDHRLTLQRVNGETKVKIQFAESCVEWGRPVIHMIYKYLQKYANKLPEDFADAMMNMELFFTATVDDIRFTLGVNPLFTLGLLGDESYAVVREKLLTADLPIFQSIVEQFDIIRSKKDTPLIVEQVAEESPEDDLHNVSAS